MILSELSSKDVVSNEDGVKLGKIIDLEVDVATGKIISIMIDRGFKLGSLFSSKNQTTISWSKIIKIGNDVIIVDNLQKSDII